VVQANGLGVAPVVLADTGNIDSAGGAKNASLLTVLASGLVSGETAHTVAIGRGSYSRSESALANLTLAVAGNTIRAGFLLARANAYCGVGPTGNTEIDALMVNGLAIAVTGAPNQTIPLAGGASMILNEQTSSFQNGSITVNAIHVAVPGVTDVVIGSAFAAISGQLVGGSGRSRLIVALLLQGVGFFCSPEHAPPCLCMDVITGGGWIIPTNTSGSANFAAAGGLNPGGNSLGHLEYIDHNTGMNVHGITIPICTVPATGSDCQLASGGDPTTSRELTGTARVRDPNGGETIVQYDVCIADNGEPGNGNDRFSITLINPNTSPPIIYTSGTQVLIGGNIQLHK